VRKWSVSTVQVHIWLTTHFVVTDNVSCCAVYHLNGFLHYFPFWNTTRGRLVGHSREMLVLVRWADKRSCTHCQTHVFDITQTGLYDTCTILILLMYSVCILALIFILMPCICRQVLFYSTNTYIFTWNFQKMCDTCSRKSLVSNSNPIRQQLVRGFICECPRVLCEYFHRRCYSALYVVFVESSTVSNDLILYIDYMCCTFITVV